MKLKKEDLTEQNLQKYQKDAILKGIQEHGQEYFNEKIMKEREKMKEDEKDKKLLKVDRVD